MGSQALIEVDGKKYMNTKTAADFWGINTRTVANYCKNNRIHNKFKCGNCWYIDINEIKPLSNKDIHRLLVLSIQLKNNPSLSIDWSSFNFDDDAINAVYQSLCMSGYVFPYDISDVRRIPYEIVLTQKGLEMATSFSTKSIPDFSTICSQWLPVLINVAQLYIEIKQA